MSKKKPSGEKIIAQNKTARLNYFIEDTLDAGISLLGTEVKALREWKANLKDSYALVKDGEVFVLEMHISPYTYGNRQNHDPLRIRKLLLHKSEIKRLYGKFRERGLALVPLKLYFKNGRVKMEIGIGRGKLLPRKREIHHGGRKEAKQVCHRHGKVLCRNGKEIPHRVNRRRTC